MKRNNLPALFIIFCLGQTTGGNAAEVIVSGGLTTGVDLYDRQYQDSPFLSTEEEEGDEDDYQRIIFQPLLSIDRATEQNTLNLTYQPIFYYDFLNDEDGINHSASLAFQNHISTAWTVSLTDTFLQADDAERLAGPDTIAGPIELREPGTGLTESQTDEDQISDDTGRRKYINNTLQLLSQYGYREDSMFTVGYGYGILRNDEEGDQEYQDYDRHEAMLSFDHRLTRNWRTSIAGWYIRGLFEEPAEDDSETLTDIGLADEESIETIALPEEPSDDLNEYRTEFGIVYEGIARHPLSVNYGFELYDFDDDAQNDTEIHNLTFGWTWLYSPHVTFNIGAGPSYAMTDDQDDTWGYNGEIGAEYVMENGSFHLAVEKGLERDDFTGEVEDNGLVDYWEGRADFSYRVLESTTMTVFAGYRYADEDVVAPIDASLLPTVDSIQQIENDLLETVTTERIYTGCSLQYSFWQRYALMLSYSYSNQTSDDPEEEYDEHQVMLTLSFSTELWRW